MTLHQRVRRQSARLSVVDTQVVNAITVIDRPLAQVDVGSGNTATSRLSSAKRTGGNTIETSEQSGNSDNTATTTPRLVLGATATPRRVDDNGCGKRSAEDSTSVSVSSKQKKERRSSKEVHWLQANVIMQTKNESMAMKLATRRIDANNQLPQCHKNKKSINQIVREVNAACESNMSPKTTRTHVKKGRINSSPLKRGPVGSFVSAGQLCDLRSGPIHVSPRTAINGQSMVVDDATALG